MKDIYITERIGIYIINPLKHFLFGREIQPNYTRLHIKLGFIVIHILLKEKNYRWNICCECGEKINPDKNIYANVHDDCRTI